MKDCILTALLDEQALVIRAMTEPTAFATLYDRYISRVYTYIRYRVEDTATANDLTSKTFEEALVNLRHYRAEKAPFGAWLFGIAHNVISHHYRAQRRWTWLSLDLVQEHASESLSPEASTIENETHRRLVCAVAQLQDRQREVIALKFGGGLTNREIATIIGLSESNIGVILYRSIKQLRQILDE